MRRLPPVLAHSHIETASIREINILSESRGNGNSAPNITALSNDTFVYHGHPERILSTTGEEISRCEEHPHKSFILNEQSIILLKTQSIYLWNIKRNSIKVYNDSALASLAPIAVLDTQNFVSAHKNRIFLWNTDTTLPVKMWTRDDNDFSHQIRHIISISENIFLTFDNNGRAVAYDINQETPLFQTMNLIMALYNGKIIPIRDQLYLFLNGRNRYFKFLKVTDQNNITLQYGSPKRPGGFKDAAMISSQIAAVATSKGLGIWHIPHTDGEPVRLLAEEPLPKNKIGSICALPSDDPNVGRLVVAGYRNYLAYWEVRLHHANPWARAVNGT